jgi:hypothetical protein
MNRPGSLHHTCGNIQTYNLVEYWSERVGQAPYSTTEVKGSPALGAKVQFIHPLHQIAYGLAPGSEKSIDISLVLPVLG